MLMPAARPLQSHPSIATGRPACSGLLATRCSSAASSATVICFRSFSIPTTLRAALALANLHPQYALERRRERSSTARGGRVGLALVEQRVDRSRAEQLVDRQGGAARGGGEVPLAGRAPRPR